MFSRASTALAAAVAAPVVETLSDDEREQSGSSGDDNARDASAELDEAELTGVAISDPYDPSQQVTIDAQSETILEVTAPVEDHEGKSTPSASPSSAAGAGAEELESSSAGNIPRAFGAESSEEPATKDSPAPIQVKKVSPKAMDKFSTDATATPNRRSQRAAPQAQASSIAAGPAKRPARQVKPLSASSAENEQVKLGGSNKEEPSTGEKRKRGRPSKAQEDGDDDAPAKQSKVSATDTPRGRGRPRKVATSPDSTKKPAGTPGRGRGRPRKPEVAANKQTKTKTTSANTAETTLRGRGRPHKSDAPTPAVAATTLTPQKKAQLAAENATQRRGRPKKLEETPAQAKKEARAAAGEANGVPKGRGRPRKTG